jgi:hypothetical protein
MKIKFERHQKRSTAKTANKFGHLNKNLSASKERNLTRHLPSDNAHQAMNLRPVQANSNSTRHAAIDLQKRDGIMYANLVRFR